MTIKEVLDAMIAKVGENIAIRRFADFNWGRIMPQSIPSCSFSMLWSRMQSQNQIDSGRAGREPIPGVHACCRTTESRSLKKAHYKRILLKISGEVLTGEGTMASTPR